MGRVDVAVHHIGVAVVGDVVETAPQSPEISEEMEALLQLKVQRKIFRKAIRSGRAYQLLLIVGDVERDSGSNWKKFVKTPIHRVCTLTTDFAVVVALRREGKAADIGTWHSRPGE